MPAGQMVFVSGTASIDADGATTHIGDVSGLFVGQILQPFGFAQGKLFFASESLLSLSKE